MWDTVLVTKATLLFFFLKAVHAFIRKQKQEGLELRDALTSFLILTL